MNTREQGREAEAVGVRIFNQVFNLRSEQDGEYVKRLAGLVDSRMQEISRLVPSGDPFKTAVLAALNIADELCRLKQSQEEQDSHVAHASSELPQERDQAGEMVRATTERGGSEGEQKAWSYEDIFEFAPARKGNDRMTEQVANRLRSRRESERDGLRIRSDEQGS